MPTLETIYAVLLVVALVLNGIALTGSTPLRTFFEPLRETRLIASITTLDTLALPVIVVVLAMLLGLDDLTRAGLVIVVATSAGPIGIALARVGRGDLPLSVTLVTGIGVLNLVTVPILAGLLLPESLPLPLGPVVSSLATLLVLPLLLGRVFAFITARLRTSEVLRTRLLGLIGRLATASLAGAVSVAVFLEPDLVLEVLAGPVTLIGFVVMILVTVAARAIITDPARRRTIILVVNARAVGLALTLVALHLGDVPGLRATVLTYGGLTQMVPILVLLMARSWERSVSR